MKSIILLSTAGENQVIVGYSEKAKYFVPPVIGALLPRRQVDSNLGVRIRLRREPVFHAGEQYSGNCPTADLMLGE